MDFSGHFRLMARLPATGGKMGKNSFNCIKYFINLFGFVP
jgi:hypothetical protein